MQLLTEHEVSAIVSTHPSTEGIDRSALDDPNSGSLLRTFLVLTQFAEQFLEAGWPAETVFWSRYYWFRRFAILRRANASEIDAGLEQQALNILEHPLPACSPDWSELEAVEQRALAA